MQKQIAEAKIDQKLLKRQQAIISSMTRQERRKPEIIKASRKQRIASGSGTSVSEVNKLLKQHQEMQRMMKQMNKLGKKGLMRHGLSALMPRH
jgi:signal recognition particle subunit SRP54